MTREEYEARMGEKVNETTFDEFIHPIYMMTELDKDAFCDEYKLHGHSRLLQDIAHYAIAQEKGVDNVTKLHDAYVDQTTRDKILTAEKLIFIADDTDSTEAYDLAVALAGQKYVTSFRVREGIDLNEQDKQYILNNLT